MTFFVYFDLIIKNNIASFLVVLIIGKVVYSNGLILVLMSLTLYESNIFDD